MDIRQPAVQKNTRGRPSAKDKKSQATKVPDLNEVPDLNDLNDVPTINHRRSTNSRSTKVPKRAKEPARHSSYTGQKIRHRFFVGDKDSEDFIDRIPEIFCSLVISIHNVLGDGNCGFRCIAHSIVQDQNRWDEIRYMLMQELQQHSITYVSMWGEEDFYHLRDTLNWFNGPAPEDYWMTMPNTGLVIASAINRPIVYIDRQGWFTCLPLFSGPNSLHGIDPIVIARVGENSGAHYICLNIDRDSVLPHYHPQWRWFKQPVANEWDAIYNRRCIL